jgi:class 3 adenylate cyclase
LSGARTSTTMRGWVTQRPFLAAVEEFLTGMRRAPEPDRALATVMFTDIVGSTERAAILGDRRWHDLRDRHHALMRRELARFRGRELETAGDGFLATFDGPARAIRCACAVSDAVKELGIEILVKGKLPGGGGEEERGA